MLAGVVPEPFGERLLPGRRLPGNVYAHYLSLDPPQQRRMVAGYGFDISPTTDDRPCVKARQPIGRITIANADASASPHTDAAINEAYRAVNELLSS